MVREELKVELRRIFIPYHRGASDAAEEQVRYVFRSMGAREVEGGFEVVIGVITPLIRPYPQLNEPTVLSNVDLEGIRPKPSLITAIKPVIKSLNSISLGDVNANAPVGGIVKAQHAIAANPVIRSAPALVEGAVISVVPKIQALPMPSIINPRITSAKEVQHGNVVHSVPEIPSYSHGTSVLRPTIKNAQTLTPAEVLTDIPKALAPARPLQTQAPTIEYADEYGEYVSLVGELVEVYDRDKILGLGGRVLADRSLLIIARRGSFDYIEFLKRFLREVFRVRVGGLPRPRHVGRELITVDANDLPSYELLDARAGGYIYVIDTRDFGNDEDKRLSKLLNSAVFVNRLRELYSQGFGFLVIYGNKAFPLGPYQEPIVIEAGDEPFYRYITHVMWGFVKDPGNEPLDHYVVEAEDAFYEALEGVAENFDVLLKTRLNAEPEGQGSGQESWLHYLTKAAVVKYLVDEVSDELVEGGVDREKARELALECVDTEHSEGGVRFDVYVKPNCGVLGGLVVEVETLYGTGTVIHKLADTIESRFRAGANKLWVVIPNPTLTIYLPEIAKVWLHYRRKYGDKLEIKTLMITKKEDKVRIEPIDIKDVIKEIINTYKKSKETQKS